MVACLAVLVPQRWLRKGHGNGCYSGPSEMKSG